MAESIVDNTTSKLTALEVLVCIKNTWLGNELIYSVLLGTEQHIFGDGAALLDDAEPHLSGEEGIWHSEGCPCPMTNGIHEFYRERPCICVVPSNIEVELVNALPSEKLPEAITTLLDYGTRALGFMLREDSLAWERPVRHFLMLAQKLDDVILAICRYLVKSTTTADAMKLFDALKSARNALEAHHRDFRHVYLFHSMACLMERGAEDGSQLVYKIVEGRGLPDELVEVIREHYIEARAQGVDMAQRREKYYKTYHDRSELDREYSRALKRSKRSSKR